MFQLSDKTRRPVCVAIFFLACVLPTLCVFAWGVSRNVPWHASSEAGRLGDQLGLLVTLEAVEHPRPGVVVYRNLELSNPETNAAILHCDQLTAQWETIESHTPCLVLIATAAKIDAAEKELLWSMLQGMLAREVGSLGYVRLVADSVEVRWTEGTEEATGESVSQQSPRNLHTLTDVQGKVGTYDQWIQADITFHTASTGESQLAAPTRIRIQRNRQGSRPFTSYVLDTGGQGDDSPDSTAPALPCDLLGLALEPFAGLGPDSRFRGYVSANAMPDGHDGRFRGEFLDIDLNRVHNQISGRANVNVRSACFRQGVLLNANAEFDARDGEISRAMLHRAESRLGLRLVEPTYNLRAEWPAPFTQIAASFVLDAKGLRALQGTCESNTPNTIMTDRNGPLAYDPLPDTILLEAVVWTLGSDSGSSGDPDALVPATLETVRLMKGLPFTR